MNKHYYFLTVLFTALIGVFTNLHAQEPAELGNYRIARIGEAQNTVTPGKWYLMGRNPYLGAEGKAFVYDGAPETTAANVTDLVANADCTGTTDGVPSNWNITSYWGGQFSVNTWSGTFPEACANFGGTPYTQFHITANDGVIPDLTISHNPVTGLASGYYLLSIDARMYSEVGTYTSANPTGIVFYANDQEVALNTGTPATDGRGYSGRYTLMLYITNGTLNFGFRVKDATCNWLAFKNVTLYKLESELEEKTVSNGEPTTGTSSALPSWNATGATGTLSMQTGSEHTYPNLGAAPTGNFGEFWNNGTTFDAATDVSHETITSGLPNGKYKVTADVYAAGIIPANIEKHDPPTQPVYTKNTTTNNYTYTVTFPCGYNYNQGSCTFALNMEDIQTALNNNFNNMSVYGKNTTSGNRSTDYLNFDMGADGWRKADGDYTTHGNNSVFCVKLISTGTNTYNVSVFGMPGATDTPGTYTAQFQFERIGKGQNPRTYTATVNVVVNFVPVYYYSLTTPLHDYEYKVGEVIVTDYEAIKTAIGAASDSEVNVWSEQSDGTRRSVRGRYDNNNIDGGTPYYNGWRDENGNFVTWGATAYYYLQDWQNDGVGDDPTEAATITDKSRYSLGLYPGRQNVPGCYTTKLIYQKGDKEAWVYITYRNVGDGKFYANGVDAMLSLGTPSTGADQGYYGTYTVETQVTDGNLYLGFYLDPNTWKWLAFQNVKLYYVDDNTTLVATENDNYDGCASKWSITDGFASGAGLAFDYWAGAMNDIYTIGDNPKVGFMQVHRGGVNLEDGTVSYLAPNGIENLAPGTYKVDVEATMASEQNTPSATIKGATFWANDGFVDLASGTPTTFGGGTCITGVYSVYASVGTDGKLNLHFTVKDANFNWLAWRSVKVYKMEETFPGCPGALMTTADGTVPVAVGDNASTAAKYLVRFNYAGNNSAKGDYYTIQMGTANYAIQPSATDAIVATGNEVGRFFAYAAEGWRDEAWTVADGVLLKATDGTDYTYYLHDTGKNGEVRSITNPTGGNERWEVDINEGNVFALYPLTLTETNPNVPTFPSLDYAGKFYKIKNRETGNYATYSTYTSSLYPELMMEKTGGYAMVTRTVENLNGASYWWFSDASSEATGEQQFAAKGTKAVRIHNVMMHDMPYTTDPHGNPTPHLNEALYSPLLGVTNGTSTTMGGRLYYLLPAAEDGGTQYWALSRTEYSSDKDSWFTNDWSLPIIGQAGAMNEEHPYNIGNRSQWVLEEVQPSEVWEKVKASKRRELHEGAYFSPTTKTLDPIFAKYVATPSSQRELLTTVENLGREIYAACTDDSLPTLAPEEGGRFYFRAYAADNHYFAENNGLTLENGREPNTVWEIVPFSDPTPIVRVDDQPLYNEFSSAYYETLLHRPLQRFWLRNRATGRFLTHAPFDKSGYTKINEGVWNMNTGGVPAHGNWQGHNKELGTMGSLEREGADLWYFDVVSNPRTGLRTGVLRTLFCYDYGPWQGTDWDGTLDDRGMPINDVDGDAIAGYNYPVVQLDPNKATVTGGGVTATDHLRAYSQWVIYTIDTDLPEVGVNYTLKNKYSGKYAYWDEGMKLTESVENLATAEDELNNNRGVWTLFDLTGKKYRIANRWAIQKNETNQNLLSGSPFSLSSTGSTFVLPTSNVDEKGIAIGTNTDLDFTKQSWMNGNVGVTRGASEDDKAVWSIDKVDRQYDDVVYDLNKMLGNLESGDDFFYVDKDAVSSYNARIAEWNTFVENTTSGALTDTQKNTEYPTYKTIKDLTNGKIGDNNFVMPVKKDGSGTRYLIRNKETGRYLSLNGQLMTVDSTDVDFYAVWDLSFEETESGTKYLYTLINEGAKYEMDAQSGDRKADYAILMWNKDGGDYAFEMAKATSTAQATKLHFRPDGEGHARLHWYKAGDTDLDDDPVLYGPTWGDRTVQSKTIKINNAYWEIIPFSDFFTAERTSAQQQSETDLLRHAFTQLEGFSGGPISMTDVNSSVVGKGTGSYDLKNLPNRVANVNTVEKMRSAMVDMWKMDEKFLLQWKPGFPLFLDNMFRPTSGARLTTGSDGVAWTTTKTKDETIAEQTFEFETAGNGVYLKNKGGNYIKTSSADDADVEATTETSNAAQLTLKEVRPGVYSMKDSQGRYLSINEDSIVVWGKRCGYGSLWRIKCNDYIPVTANQVKAESELWPGKYVKTYYSDYDTRMERTDGLTPYFAKNDAASAGERELTDGSKEQQVKIHFTPVTAGTDGYYYMEGGQSYILVKDTQMDKTEIKIWSQYKGGDESIAGKNILSIQKDQIDITADNQRTLFALNYITPGTAIGTIGGQTVTSFGLGFYPLKQGGRIPSYVPFISAETIGDAIRALRENIKNAGSEVKGEVFAPSMQIVLEDEDGNVTDAIDIPIGNVDLCDGPVFDLSGRKVAEHLSNVSRKGVYIVNGQKVLRK